MDEQYLIDNLEMELEEELTDKTVKSSTDKVKVARTIAEILGYTKGEEFNNPTQIINNALKRYKSKAINGEAINLVNRIVGLARKAGIEFDEELVPKKVQQMGVSEAIETIAEALSMQSRRKRAAKMRMMAPLMKRKRATAVNKMASTEKLLMRAHRAAHNRILQKRFLKNRKYSDLSATEKFKFEKLMQPFSGAVARLAKKLLPKVRQKEQLRFQKTKQTPK